MLHTNRRNFLKSSLAASGLVAWGLNVPAFLSRTARIFHLWHVVHRPFSISFVALILVHICVALSVGF